VSRRPYASPHQGCVGEPLRGGAGHPGGATRSRGLAGARVGGGGRLPGTPGPTPPLVERCRWRATRRSGRRRCGGLAERGERLERVLCALRRADRGEAAEPLSSAAARGGTAPQRCDSVPSATPYRPRLRTVRDSVPSPTPYRPRLRTVPDSVPSPTPYRPRLRTVPANLGLRCRVCRASPLAVPLRQQGATSDRGIPPIDEVIAARDEGGLVREEEAHARGDLGRAAEPPQGVASDEPRPRVAPALCPKPAEPGLHPTRVAPAEVVEVT
jgi:hypothetical protein